MCAREQGWLPCESAAVVARGHADSRGLVEGLEKQEALRPHLHLLALALGKSHHHLQGLYHREKVSVKPEEKSHGLRSLATGQEGGWAIF